MVTVFAVLLPLILAPFQIIAVFVSSKIVEISTMFTTAIYTRTTNNPSACSVSQRLIQSSPDNSIRRSYNFLCCCLCQGSQFCAHKAFFAVYLYHHISTKFIRCLLLSPPPSKKNPKSIELFIAMVKACC